MRSVRLGRSDVSVTELGFGAAGIGNLYERIDDDTAFGALEAAWHHGIRFFDTAPHYGLGLSERRLGAYLGSRPRDQYVISTKVGRLLRPRAKEGQRATDSGGFDVNADYERIWDFSRDGVLASLDASLSRLDSDRVDIVLLHDPDEHWSTAISDALPTLSDLRSQGVIGAIGVGMNQWQMLLRFVQHADLDMVMLAGRYTLLEQPALQALLPACFREGVSVVAAGVFNSGVLAKTVPDQQAMYNYQPAPPSTIRKAEQLAEVCCRHGTTLPAAALHFPLQHPAVDAIVVGAQTADQVTVNALRFAETLPAAVWDDLKSARLIDPDSPTQGGL